ncbi:MAG: hypothetical protein V2A71_10375, partial [Candidatus Eisenbacteria bacterium]
VGVKFYLGGLRQGELTELDRALQDQLGRGWRGIAFRLEPAGGKIDLDEALGFRENQHVVGLSAGIDLGPYAGLRGFYWRGMEENSWSRFDDLQAYGGEIKLAFADIGGDLTPYVTVGGGYMDVMEGYVGNGVVAPEDKPFALGGIGLVLPLGTALSIDVGLRSLLMSTTGVDNLSDPAGIKFNTMFTVGVSFGLGGGKGQTLGRVFGREMAASKAERERLVSQMREVDGDLTSLQSQVDSLTAVVSESRIPPRDLAGIPDVARLTAPVPPAPKAEPAAKVEAKPKAVPKEKETAVTPAEPEPKREGRWMTLPVPEEGELYLRFGTPGGVSIETIEGEPLIYYLDPSTGALISAPPLVRTPSVGAPAAVPSPPPPASPGVSPVQVEEIVRRVLREERAQAIEKPAPPQDTSTLTRLETALDMRMRGIEAQLSSLKLAAASPARPAEVPEARQPATVIQTPAPAAVTAPRVQPGFEVVQPAPEPSLHFGGLAVVTGYNVDRPHQVLMGVSADFLHRERPFKLVPQLIFGAGDDDLTTNVNLNALYDLGFGLLDRLDPYGGIGLGFLNRDELELVLNLVVGTNVRAGTSTLFVEYMNQDFFDNNRLLAGYRFNF